jgi:hypothetical protein
MFSTCREASIPAEGQRYSDGLDGRVLFLAGTRFVPLHVVQTGSGAHPASYPMGTGGSFPEGKAAAV